MDAGPINSTLAMGPSSASNQPAPVSPGSGGQPRAGVLIVCGSSLDAERSDRPIAYGLASRIEAWSRAWSSSIAGAHHESDGLEPVVCTDLWYLNHDELRSLPTISIGHPGTNALSAHLARRLPEVHSVAHRLVVQMDPAFEELIASCWGVDAKATGEAVDVFTGSHLDPFCQAACAALSSER